MSVGTPEQLINTLRRNNNIFVDFVRKVVSTYFSYKWLHARFNDAPRDFPCKAVPFKGCVMLCPGLERVKSRYVTLGIVGLGWDVQLMTIFSPKLTILSRFVMVMVRILFTYKTWQFFLKCLDNNITLEYM